MISATHVLMKVAVELILIVEFEPEVISVELIPKDSSDCLMVVTNLVGTPVIIVDFICVVFMIVYDRATVGNQTP